MLWDGSSHITLTINKENVPHVYLNANLMEAFAQLRSLFPIDSSLWQVDKGKQNKTNKIQIKLITLTTSNPEQL